MEIPVQAAIARRGDARPFLVRAAEAALASGAWTPIDLDIFTSDVVAMAFRFLAREGGDPRDLDAVGRATDLVLLYVDDGLRLLAVDDVARGADLLTEDLHTPVQAFRASWSATEDLRGAMRAFHDRRTVVIGPRGNGIAVSLTSAELATCADVRRVSDAALLTFIQHGERIDMLRTALAHELAVARAGLELAQHLPFASLAACWRRLLIADTALVSVGNIEDFATCAWATAIVRMVMRGDFGITVTPKELADFVHAHILEEPYGLRGDSLEYATRGIARALDALDAHVDHERLRTVISDAAGALLALHTSIATFGFSPQSGMWMSAWGPPDGLVILEVTSTGYELVIGALSGVLDGDVLIEQFCDAESPRTQATIGESLPWDRMLAEDAVRVLGGTLAANAPFVVGRLLLARVRVDVLEQYLCAEKRWAVHVELCARVRALGKGACAGLSAAGILALTRGTQRTRDAYRELVDVVAMDERTFFRCFRSSEDARERQEWLVLAMAQPAFFQNVLDDIQTFPPEVAVLEALLRGAAAHARIPPAFLTALFLARGRVAFTDGVPQFRDAMRLWLWDRLSDDARRIVQAALEARGAPASPPKPQKRRRARKRKRA